MTFIASLVAVLENNPQPDYGVLPQPAYGVQPSLEVAFGIIKFLPYIIIITLISLTIGIFLQLKKKKNVKGSAKKR